MKRIFSALKLAAILLLPALALAAGTTANLSWTAPTQYTDNTSIAAGELDHYTIAWAPQAGKTGPTGSLTVAGTLTSATVPVACGDVTFTLTVTTSATAKYPNATSGPAGPVPYVSGVSCAPNPPGAFTAN